MIKRPAISFVVLLCGVAAVAAPRSPVDEFVLDKEFCAYMASTPGYESDTFLVRYQAAMQAAVLFIWHEMPQTSYTQAIFEIRAQCDEALEQLIHYR